MLALDELRHWLFRRPDRSPVAVDPMTYCPEHWSGRQADDGTWSATRSDGRSTVRCPSRAALWRWRLARQRATGRIIFLDCPPADPVGTGDVPTVHGALEGTVVLRRSV